MSGAWVGRQGYICVARVEKYGLHGKLMMLRNLCLVDVLTTSYVLCYFTRAEIQLAFVVLSTFSIEVDSALDCSTCSPNDNLDAI